uniref:RCC1 and BTB domain-containing protein 1 n=1 Tax=Lygus hesperus TaxID=30085 RepID=A0A146KWL9_LYGHE
MSGISCVQSDLSHWDLLKPLSNSDQWNVKAFCVFRAHGGTAALVISEQDEVFGVCSELSDVSLLGVSSNDGLLKPEPFHPFKIPALSGKNLQAFSIGVIVGAALDSSGRLYWWGRTSEDQNVIQPPQIAKSKIEPPPSFIEVHCGHSFMAALSTEGKVYVWGRLICSSFECEELIVDSPVVSLSCGAVHVVMLTSDLPEVYTWGSGFDGQRGYLAFTEKDTYKVKKLELNEPCVSLVCGPVSTLMLLESGEVWACGENSEDLGFLGVDSKMKKIRVPTRVSLKQKAITISTAWLSPKPYALYTAVLSDKDVYTWGPHFPPRPLHEGSNFINVFRNNCTPREMGMIYLDCSENTEANLSSSIEVLSISQAPNISPKGPDLLNQSSKRSPLRSSMTCEDVRSVETTSSMLKFSAELFGSSKLSDITFLFEDSSFPGHRLFLCSRSKLFREILDLDVPAAANPVMHCTSHDPIAFKGLLQYLYTGHHVVQELPHLLELHSLALVFSERLLAEDAADKISDLLETDNILRVIAKARAMQSPYLVSKCESYITYLSAAKPGLMAKLFMNSISSNDLTK